MTLYSVSYFCGEEETPCALFSDTTPEDVIMTFCDNLFDVVVGCTCVRMTNLDTMLIVYEVRPCTPEDFDPLGLDDYALECLEHANDCDPDWEPADVDDDCGFDPYMGCYTDDV